MYHFMTTWGIAVKQTSLLKSPRERLFSNMATDRLPPIGNQVNISAFPDEKAMPGGHYF